MTLKTMKTTAATLRTGRAPLAGSIAPSCEGGGEALLVPLTGDAHALHWGDTGTIGASLALTIAGVLQGRMSVAEAALDRRPAGSCSGSRNHCLRRTASFPWGRMCLAKTLMAGEARRPLGTSIKATPFQKGNSSIRELRLLGRTPCGLRLHCLGVHRDRRTSLIHRSSNRESTGCHRLPTLHKLKKLHQT